MNNVTQVPRFLVARFQARFQAVFTGERGASMVEYALLVGLIAMVAILGVTLFGQALGDEYTGIAGSVVSATGG